ncbi:MAG: polyprenyl synthetase family protein, partial [Deltaproteobacteria bacterium]|nr:polyprenyl synthetase family protein [Deltaproteobacteria bacterium]
MQMAQVFELVREDLQKVDAECRRNIASEGGLIAHVGEYIILSGGKRIRPMLLLLCARLCGYQGERQIPIGTVLEFIHTATLLHDDVIDQATQRRGNPSAHTIWGSTASVLVGDFLFAKAFHLMVQDGDLRILNILSEMTTRIARGEIHELVKSYDVTLGEEEYLEIIRDKTACLFSAACQIGGVLGGISPAQVDALAGLGMRLGMAFQLVDDTLDYTPAGEGFGKDPGTDLREGKVTLPLIYTLQKCTAEE